MARLTKPTEFTSHPTLDFGRRRHPVLASDYTCQRHCELHSHPPPLPRTSNIELTNLLNDGGTNSIEVLGE